MRFVLEICYKGTRYHGWQKQHNAKTVQGELELALSIILKVFTPTLGSGRTDTGVHALQQFVQFDTDHMPEYKRFIHSLQQMLPWDIAIRGLYIAEADFSVRHHAIHRAYIYAIHQVKDPFLVETSTFLPGKSPDLDVLQRASSYLLEMTDYSSFCKYHTANKHFECNVFEAYWTKTDYNYKFYIRANRFLHGMVRGLVGSIWAVGIGNLDIESFKKIFEAKDRKAAGVAMPAEGLHLYEVAYKPGQLKKVCSVC